MELVGEGQGEELDVLESFGLHLKTLGHLWL